MLPTPVAVAAAGAIAAVNRLRGVESEVNPVSMRYFARRGGYSIEKARLLLDYEPAVSLRRRDGAHGGVAAPGTADLTDLACRGTTPGS